MRFYSQSKKLPAPVKADTLTHEPIELTPFQIAEIAQAKTRLDTLNNRMKRAQEEYQKTIFRPIDAQAKRLKINRENIVSVDQSKPGFMVVTTKSKD